jgi:hypothetical protein
VSGEPCVAGRVKAAGRARTSARARRAGDTGRCNTIILCNAIQYKPEQDRTRPALLAVRANVRYLLWHVVLVLVLDLV